MVDWNKLATRDKVESVVKALKERGIDAEIVESGEEAKKRVLELIPSGAEVMHVTSTTLDQIGVSKAIESGNYVSLRKVLMSIDDETERKDARRKSLSPDYGIGSVQAVTEAGQVVSISASGSQLPVYAYGAKNVIWVVSTDKIVKNIEEAYKRVYDYVLPLESERVRKVYKIPGSAVMKILIFEKEMPGRIKLIFVNEKLGF